MAIYGFNEKLKKKIYYLENKQKLLTNHKLYNLDNSEQIADYQKIYQQEYRKNNPRQKVIRVAKVKIIKPKKIKCPNIKTRMELILHRHLLKCKRLGQVDNFLTLDEWNSILLYFDNSCCFCRNEELYIGYVIPPSRKLGKGLEYGNVIPICKSCRSSKKNLLLNEWSQYSITMKYYPEKVNKIINYIKERQSCK